VQDIAAQASDEELLTRGGAGDRRAFEGLVERHENALFRYALRLCGGEREAEDALQDGLLAAWRGAATFRGEAAARTWLFQVVIHACRRGRRRKVGEPERHDDVTLAVDLAAQVSPPDERASARQVTSALEEALAAMPDDAREVLVLRDVEGLSGEETAAALGVGLAAMKSRLHRARLELKERVEALLGHAVLEEMS